MLAKLSRQSVTSSTSGRARWTLRWRSGLSGALGLADYVSFRDSDSRSRTKGWIHLQKPVFGRLRLCSPSFDGPGDEWRRTSGTTRRAFSHGILRSSGLTGKVPGRLLTLHSRHCVLLAAGSAKTNLIIAYKSASLEISFDSHAIEEVKALLGRANGDLRRMVKREDTAGIDELLATMRPMDHIVTCRFHGSICASAE